MSTQKSYEMKDLRNVCLVGSQGDGKTTVAEAMIFNAGAISRMGRVEDGNTVCDCNEEEIVRKTSVSLETAFLEYNDKKINLLVTPGYPDFVGEIYAGISVAESALFVIGADAGINPIGENIWEYLDEKKIPTAIFLNKNDKENIDLKDVVQKLKDKLNNNIVVLTIPDVTGAKFSLVNNVLSSDESKEAISSIDDTLMEEYLEGKDIPEAELKAALQKAISERKIIPLLCGSATKNIGIKELMNFVVEYLPAPAAVSNEHLSVLVFKTLSEPGMGHLNFVRIFSGKLQTGQDVYNFTRSIRERTGQLCFMQGKKKTDVHIAASGDIVSLVKLRDTKTNDVLGDEKNQPSIKQIVFPETVYDRAIITPSKGDEEKVGTALSIITVENPTIKYHYNPETKQMIVSGLGALQIEVMAHRLKSHYGVLVELHPPRVPYKETVHGKADVQGKYKRQSGGRGQYGDCWLTIESLPRGKGFEFTNKVVGGAIPRNYIPAIEKGVHEAMEQGVIAGYPVVDVHVSVYDGSYHEVDSSDMAFKIAGSMALRKGVTEAKPTILEPIMDIRIVLPDEYMGAVMGDLNSRRGKVMGMDKIGKKQIINAQVPMGEIFQYATDLRSLTRGSGKFSLKLSHYEEAPAQIAQPLIEHHQKTKVAELV